MEQDDLELISIGALYRGQFEKKYWSSSRGKDRYPYPIGYHASRIIFGQKCKMQISEGPRGPLFMVGSDDGDLCIGLTPDLAWENFNKKNSPKIQNGQGKRLSSKIDGAELFGLKNKIVKRLLRQLITASSGSPKEQIYSSSEEQISKSSKIIPIEILQQISCNINNNSNNNNSYSNNNNNSSSNNNNNNSNNDNDNNNVHPYKIICYKRKRSINKQKIEEKKAKKVMVSDSQKENRVDEESAFGAENNELVMKTSDNEIVLEREKHVISQENCAILQNSPFQAETLLEIPKKEDFLKTVPNSPEDTQNEAMKDIFITNELVKDISIINEEIEKESTIQNISIINEAAEKDNSIENLSIINEEVERENTKENISIINEEVERENTIENFSIINEVVERESNREDISIIEKERTIEDINIINEIVRDSQTSNFSSQKTDESSEKQELTRSMMEFLLPQAVPLLKQKYTRKRFKNKHIQNDSFKDGEMKSEAMSQELKEETIISEVVKNNLVTKEGANLQNDHGEEGISVIADSFEDNSNQKFESSILSPVTKQGADLQNGHSTCVIADSFEDNLNQKIESSILSSVIKQGTDLQNGLGEDTCVIADSFEDNLDNKLNSSMSSPVKKEGASFQNELREVTCVIADSVEDNSNNNINSSILTPVTKQGANLQNDHEEGTHVIADSFEDNSNQKIDSSISSPVKKEGTNLQNDHEEGTHVIADSFEDNSNQKIDSSISNPVTKQGANLQNDHEAGTLIIADSFEDKNQQIDPSVPISTKEGANLQNDHADLLTDSFLAGLEDKFCLIENEAIKNKTNIDNHINTSEILIKSSKNSEIPKLNPNPNSSNTNEFTNSPLDRFGPYEHQEPVLSIKLNSKDNNCLEIFVLCGELNSYKRFIYIYNLVLGQPSFVGYTSILINSDPFNENLQYISEGRLLAIIPIINVPYCRKMCINCSCSICKLEQDEENFLKLVQVDFGYVVPVIKLKINEKISSVLFCKPNYIIAVEKTRLHVWIMSPNFREISDEFELSTLDNIILSIFELHQVQGSNNSLVFGHNGFHDFLLWDISKRVLIAKFQAQNSNISKIIPLNCFNINKSEFSNINQNIKLCLKNNPMQLGDNNCMVVYLLVKSFILPECENDLNAKNNQNWRLAILANNTLFVGHFLDPRISVIDGCNKFVLAGTNDGFCYKLDLNTGTKLASMDCFSSGSISNIAFDPKSGAVAVANNQNQLLVYTQQN